VFIVVEVFCIWPYEQLCSRISMMPRLLLVMRQIEYSQLPTYSSQMCLCYSRANVLFNFN